MRELGFMQKRKMRRELGKIIRSKMEDIKELKFGKMYNGNLSIDYRVGGKEIHVELNEKREIAFATINLNYYLDAATDEDMQMWKEQFEGFIRKDKDRLRLLI